MKIIICCSLTASKEVLEIRDELIKLGHLVEIPHGVKKYEKEGKTYLTSSENRQAKIDHDLIRGYFNKIKENDALLVVNPEKKGIPGYIGGNTLIELAFGFVLDKPLYLTNPMPDMSYTAEIEAMMPMVLNGDYSKIN